VRERGQTGKKNSPGDEEKKITRTQGRSVRGGPGTAAVKDFGAHTQGAGREGNRRKQLGHAEEKRKKPRGENSRNQIKSGPEGGGGKREGTLPKNSRRTVGPALKS